MGENSSEVEIASLALKNECIFLFRSLNNKLNCSVIMDNICIIKTQLTECHLYSS